MSSFCEDNAAFERWLAKQCDVVTGDLAHKHKRMAQSPFAFLRATYFRWAKTIADHCPDLAKAPNVLAVGDIHVENYGVWRDLEGRLVWGVNDFDEAAKTPYAFDLVRLAASAALSPRIDMTGAAIASCILDGYRAGLADPRPVLLDRENVWMRPLVMCSATHRAKFWAEIDALPEIAPPAAAREALIHDLPNRARVVRFAKRRKGGGSLGKPRFVLIASWRGGPLIREAKTATASSWTWAHRDAKAPPPSLDLARGPSRAPDPYLDLRGGFLLRRLAPDSRKIEFESGGPRAALSARIFGLMGQELGALHAGRAAPILKDLDKRRKDWLAAAARDAVRAVEADYKEWTAHMALRSSASARGAKAKASKPPK